MLLKKAPGGLKELSGCDKIILWLIFIRDFWACTKGFGKRKAAGRSKRNLWAVMIGGM